MVFLDGTSVFIVGGWVGEGKAGWEGWRFIALPVCKGVTFGLLQILMPSGREGNLQIAVGVQLFDSPHWY
jgi:hypothetical protein